ARHEGAAAVLIGGDLFEHELVSPDTVEFLRLTFERSGLRVFAAPGNHDYADTESRYRRVDWPDNVHIFSETHFTSRVLADGLTIWGAAHRKPVDTPGFFDDGFRVEGSGTHIAVFHGEERNAAFQGQYRHAPFESDQIAAAGFDHAVVGHSHKPADRPTWTRLGSLERLKFNEAYGTAVILEVENGRVTPRRLDPRPPALHSLKVDLTEAENADEARARVTGALADLAGAARIQLTGEPEDLHLHADDFAAGAFDPPDGIDQVLVDTSGLTSPYDLEQIEQEPKTVQGMFVQRVRKAELDQKTERLVLLAGLRALDGREIGLVNELRMNAGDEAPSDETAATPAEGGSV
ncbi:MAG: metallophosphoesterase, partial [Acidobacteria bacterium]|nr:metallophosphoesterase [Acidobacteriota bacterium]